MAHAGRLTAALVTGVSLVALTAATVAPSATAAAGSPPAAAPSVVKGLKAPVAQPAELDAVSSYFPQVSCSPTTLPGTARLRDLTLRTYKIGGNGGTTRGCAIGGQSEHKEGRAWDWMLNVKNAREKAAAGDFIAWLTAGGGTQARRLGVMYVIYNKKIWSSYRPGWRAYNGAQDHTDHVHVSLSWAGARGKTSFWTGKVGAVDFGPCRVFSGQPAGLRKSVNPQPCADAVASPKRSKNPTLYLGAAGKKVRTAQRVAGTKVTGRFDTRTWNAVKRFQKANDLPRTGVVDAATWSAMKPARVSHDAGRGQTAASAAAYGRTHYGSLRLAKRSAGTPVLFLQIALGMPKQQQNGYFGAKTQAAVQRVQAARGLRRTGVVDTALWSRIGR